MVLLRMSKEADFLFQTAGHENDLRVVRFRGEESVSRPFSFVVELASLDSAIDFDAVVGKPGLLTLYHEGGRRYVNGRVLGFEQTREGTEYTYYEARLVPIFWFLRYRRDQRIFQKKDVRRIIEQVLGDAGIPGDQYRFALQKAYETREYCVQYGESDFDFISRLMEEEGIFYFFEHSKDNHVMVMGDSPVAHVPIDGDASVSFREYTGLVQDADYVSEWRYGQKVRSGAVVMRDFNFKQPQLDLEVNQSASRDTSLEVYDYPGRYDAQGRGKGLAKVRLEGIQAVRREGRGASLCRRLAPGFRFSLSQHPRSDFNREYLLLDVSHQGAQPQVAGHEAEAPGEEEPLYLNRFTCIDSDQAFHPPLETPKPVIKGTQTAIVVGPKGEEIYTDEHGRVKVHFHWDREDQMDENSSCWIRVSQGWAGGRYGILYLPRIGQEVIVDFLEGDPDRPIVIGRVYNGDLRPPYALPDEKTKSTIKSNTTKGGGGYNEIRFEDLAGQEQIFVHAQKDQDLRVENDRREWIGNDRSLIVKNDKKTLVENDAHTTIQGADSTHIEKDASLNVKGDSMTNIDGDAHLRIKGDSAGQIMGGRSLIVTGEVVESYAASHKQSVGAELVYQAGTKVVIDAGLELTIKAAGGFIKIDPMGVTIQGNLVLVNSGGAPGLAVPGVPTPPKPPETPAQPDQADDGKPGSDVKGKASPTAPEAEPYQPYVFKMPEWPLANQSKAMKDAAKNGRPFCEKCEKARQAMMAGKS